MRPISGRLIGPLYAYEALEREHTLELEDGRRLDFVLTRKETAEIAARWALRPPLR